MIPEYPTTEAVCELCGTLSFALAVDIAGNGQNDERVPICDECAFRIAEHFETAMDDILTQATKKLGW